MAVLLLFSFLLTHRYYFQEIKTPIISAGGIFVLAVLPSYIKTNSLITASLILHLVFFFSVIAIFLITIKDYKRIKWIVVVFVSMCLINSIDVIITGFLSGKRVFGFAGIMFVDYVACSIVICSLVFMTKKNWRLISFLLFTTLSVALILTQTRGVWIVAGITIFLMIIHVVFKSKLYGVKRSGTILIAVSVITVLVVVVLSIKGFDQGVFKRIEVKKIEQTDDPAHLFRQINSLTSRYLIWSTAWNAFKANPVTGIGLYSFPFESKMYSTVSPVLYTIFVRNLTPHETFLALLAETGLIGLTGFLIFLIYTVYFAIKSVKMSITRQQIFYSTLIFWLTIYVCFSMIDTDAWLWGHGIVLWGILLGMSAGNRKIINEYQLNENKPIQVYE